MVLKLEEWPSLDRRGDGRRIKGIPERRHSVEVGTPQGVVGTLVGRDGVIQVDRGPEGGQVG